MSNSRYIGIDLAWGERATTAAVVLEGIGDSPAEGARYFDAVDNLTDDDSLIDFVRRQDSGGNLLIGIDAPTLVPNQTGMRPCEAVVSCCLRRYEAGTHPANRKLLAKSGAVRGERLVNRLAALGISHTPVMASALAGIRICFEVFPHAAHIGLFGLSRTLKYKSKPNRTWDERLASFQQYRHLLEGLRTASPPLILPEETRFWLRRDPASLGAAGLKRHEDAMDALTCAYVALFRYAQGAERCPAVGDRESGYIVTPVTEAMSACFRETAGKYGTGVF